MQKKRFYHAARRIFTGLCLAFAVTSANADSANADDFTDLQKAAKGQTVYLKWNDGLAVTHQGTQGALVPEKSILAIV